MSTKPITRIEDLRVGDRVRMTDRYESGAVSIQEDVIQAVGSHTVNGGIIFTDFGLRPSPAPFTRTWELLDRPVAVPSLAPGGVLTFTDITNQPCRAMRIMGGWIVVINPAGTTIRSRNDLELAKLNDGNGFTIELQGL